METLEGKDVIVIRVAPIKGVLPYKGRHFTRVVTTNRDMPLRSWLADYLSEAVRAGIA